MEERRLRRPDVRIPRVSWAPTAPSRRAAPAADRAPLLEKAGARRRIPRSSDTRDVPDAIILEGRGCDARKPGVADVRRSRGRSGRDVGRVGGRTARQFPAQSVSDGGGLGEDARGPDVGSDERGRDRTGRQVHLGRGEMRREHLRRLEPARDPQVRRRPAGSRRASARGMFIFPHGIHVDRGRQRLGDRRAGTRTGRGTRSSSSARTGSSC